jgi:hypothetical protein
MLAKRKDSRTATHIEYAMAFKTFLIVAPHIIHPLTSGAKDAQTHRWTNIDATEKL